MRVVKAAAVQLSPVLYSRDGTVDKVVRTIHTLGQQYVPGQLANAADSAVDRAGHFAFDTAADQIAGLVRGFMK